MSKVTTTETKIREFDAVAPPEENLGLCSTCDNLQGCIYQKDQKHAVMQCEEYGESSVSDRTATRPEPEEPPAVSQPTPATVFKGLCTNCAKRETCTFVKPEIGIWHCEEYE